MIADYDITVLVTATPPRHQASKQVITSVTGRVDIPDVDDLEPAATLSRHDGTEERRIFASTSGEVFEHAGNASPDAFTDGAGGLRFLREYRLAVSEKLRNLPPSSWRTQFHPGGKIVSAEDFGRVDPWSSGATPLQTNVIETARRRVEAHLSQYVVMGGEIYRRASEPFLVLSADEGFAHFRLEVETDVRDAAGKRADFEPIACFGLDQAKAARALAASLVPGQRPRLKGDGIKVSGVDPTKFRVDPVAMTFRAAAVRMYRNYVAEADGMWDVEGALTGLSLEGIIAFRRLSDAISKSWDDVDAIDAAVHACLEYEAAGGDNAFSGRAMVVGMIEAWNDRPIGVGLSRSGFAARP
ncbi:hypothetical protein HFO56_24300 [Rhizobium laguerreae]|uniref:hypothetical protein n=1 Tax=Rhizobium laguerreae TaxID=1076926 RepID=UPI001C90C38C|nr:hypothetical protein [Rhizobium laguerreae]MBY3155452.1 hypothetical protein [Rhizobium laguerreae]